MIRFNLNTLLGQRNLKISKVFADTGISRSTLTKIARNESSMVQLDTIDKLCQYLSVEPKEFFEYIPVSMEVTPVFDQDIGILNEVEVTDLEGDFFIKFHNLETKEEKEFQFTVSTYKWKDHIYPNILDSVSALFDDDGVVEGSAIRLNKDYNLSKYIDKITKGKFTLIQHIWETIEKELNNSIKKCNVDTCIVLFTFDA